MVHKLITYTLEINKNYVLNIWVGESATGIDTLPRLAGKTINKVRKLA